MNINERCIQGCSLLPEHMQLEERAQHLAGVLAEIGVTTTCTEPRIGICSTICGQPEAIKVQLHKRLRESRQLHAKQIAEANKLQATNLTSQVDAPKAPYLASAPIAVGAAVPTHDN